MARLSRAERRRRAAEAAGRVAPAGDRSRPAAGLAADGPTESPAAGLPTPDGAAADRAPRRPLDQTALVGLGAALWINAVMLHGLLLGGWSPAAVLVLYWLEHLCRQSLGALRIAVHRQLTDKRGHYRQQFKYGPKLDHKTREFRKSEYGDGSYLGEYVTLAIASQLTIIAILLYALYRMQDWTSGASPLHFVGAQLMANAWVILVPLLAQALVEALELRSRSFAWLRTTTGVTLRSGNLIATAFLIAMLAAKVLQMPNLQLLAVVLVGVKLLYECSLVLAGRDWEQRYELTIDDLFWGRKKGYHDYRGHEEAMIARDEETRASR